MVKEDLSLTSFFEVAKLAMFKIVVYREVKPQDGSETLPAGNYEARDLRWLSFKVYEGEGYYSYDGLATFVVASGPHASERRRIGVVVQEDEEHLHVIDALNRTKLAFERRVHVSTRKGLTRAREMLTASSHPDSAYALAVIEEVMSQEGW